MLVYKHEQGLNGTVKMMPPNQDDPRRRKPNITRATKELGWRPVVSSACVCVCVTVCGGVSKEKISSSLATQYMYTPSFSMLHSAK